MTERTTDLGTAVAAHLSAKQQAHEAATAPERQAREEQAAADAKLFNTPAWEQIGPRRRQLATQYAARPAQGGGNDAD
jgi:hypothetical protein